MSERNSGSLAQKYAQILMGFLIQAIIQFQAMQKEPGVKKQPSNVIAQPGSLQAFLGKIETAFGDLKLDSGLQKQSPYPLIHWQDLALKFKNYLLTHEITLQVPIFQAVMRDLLKMKILVPSLVLKQDPQNQLYEINTAFFRHQEIERQGITFKQTLENKLFKVVKNEIAREILLHLALLPSLSDEEVHYYYHEIPAMRSIIFFNSRFGRGYLLSVMWKKGIRYRHFMHTVDLLVQNGLLIEGCDEISLEYLMLNPMLKPFSVVAELIRALREKEQKPNLMEIEASEENANPLGSMVSLSSLNPAAKDIYLFESFEVGLQGL